ncbi:MAG: FIST N-terminal domain-containing protein, partial [Myxococcota bacterium]
MKANTLSYDLSRRRWSGAMPSLDSERTLVVAFGSPAARDDLAPFRELRAAYPRSVIVGCSTAGEICGDVVRDDSIAVSVARFDHTTLKSAVIAVEDPKQSRASGRALARSLAGPDLRAVFVLSEGIRVNGTELVAGLNEILSERVVVTGGLAGDGTRFGETWVCVGSELSGGVVAAVGFYGRHLAVGHGSMGGWDKFGPERTITRSDGNVLYEIDGKPALALYKEYLGPKAAGLPATGLLFPLALRAHARDDKVLVRTLLAVDEAAQSLTFAGDVPENFLVQLMKADFERLITGAAGAAAMAVDAAPSSATGTNGTSGSSTLALAVSCVGRRLVLGDRIEEEVEAVRDGLPPSAVVAGFYSYGELSPFAKGKCDLHNQTMTLTTLSEVADPLPDLEETTRPITDEGVTETRVELPFQVRTAAYDLATRAWTPPLDGSDSTRALVLAFGDPAAIDDPAPFRDLREAYPNGVLAGCSGSGEIVGTEVRDGVVTVAIARFVHTDLRAVSSPITEVAASYRVGEQLGRMLRGPDLRAVFVVSDGLVVNGSELVRGLNDALPPEVIVTGGLAGDGTRFARTWVAHGATLEPNRVVAIGLYGDHLIVGHGSKGGWDKFGPERVITRSRGNVVYEIDGRPALALYKEYLGPRASGLPASGLLFPLALREHLSDDRALVRTLLGVDEAEQSLTFAGDVPEGWLSQLMKADFDRLVDGATGAAAATRASVPLSSSTLAGVAPTLAIAVSCVGRRLVLGDRTEEEVEAVLDALPTGTAITGFYSYGELSPFATGRCDLHNQTMTLTTFTESPTPIRRPAPASTARPVMAEPRPLLDEPDTRNSELTPAPTGRRRMTSHAFTFDLATRRWSVPAPPPVDSPRTLVLAFGAPELAEDHEPLLALSRAYPTSQVVGCSGAGEIVGTEVRDGIVSVVATRFEHTDLTVATARVTAASESYDAGRTLARELTAPDLRAVFVLSEGITVNGSDLVRGLNDTLSPTVVVSGGLAGDGTRFQRTWVLANGAVTSGTVVAVGLYGAHLAVGHGSKGGWDQFGAERTISRSTGNVLYEIDGRPALALYKEYLGPKATELPSSGLLFPLAMRADARDDKVLVRTLLAVDEAAQSLTFAGDVPQGYLVRLMKADFDRLVDGASDATRAALGIAPHADSQTLAIAVSCVGRRLVLGERTDDEVEAVKDALPTGAIVTGFYSYGELSPYATGRCDLHNQTMTITTFAELDRAWV